MVPLRLAAIVIGISYLFARVAFTWRDTNPVLFVLLLAAEIFGMWRLWVEMSMVGAYVHAAENPPLEAADSDAPGDAQKVGGFEADAVVMVNYEPISEIRAALLAAAAANGIRKVWVVYREDRYDVTELAERLDIDSLFGSPGCDIGPLVDRAMRLSKAEFMALIPADVVVLADVIAATVPELSDPSIAAVRCRVEMKNASKTIDHGAYGLDHYRDRVVAPRLHKASELPWFPGLAVVRRQEVLSVGGIGDGHWGGTLDAGRRLRSGGWSISQGDAVVGRQLVAWSDARQLRRWVREIDEQLKLGRVPRQNHTQGRSFGPTRLVRSSALIHVFQPMQKIVLIGVLFATLYTPAMPISGGFPPLIALWAAWQASSLLLRWAVSREAGFMPWITSDLRLMATNMIVGWRALRGANLGAEPADSAPGKKLRSAMMIVLQIALTVTLIAFGLGLVRAAHSNIVSAEVLALALWLLVASLNSMSGIKLRQVRRTYRTFEELRVIDAGSRMAVIGVSPSGVDLVSREEMTVGRTVDLTFQLPQGDGISINFTTSLSVVRSARSARHFVAYLRFVHLTDEQFDQIIIYCSVVAGCQRAGSGSRRLAEVAEES